MSGWGTRTRVGAYCVVTQGERILLCRVAEGYPGAGCWTLPGGGVDWGEQPEVGALRELHEEAGLTGSDAELLGTDSRSYTAEESLRGERLFWVRLYYRVEAAGEPQVLDVDGSTDAVAWHDASALDDLELVDLVRVGISLSEE